MERAFAAQLMAAVLALDTGLGAIDHLISDVDDEGERRLLARRLGNVFLALDEELIRPIAREFPDLDPTNER